MPLHPSTRRITGLTMGLSLAASALVLTPANATAATASISGHVTTTPIGSTAPSISTGLDVWLFTADDVFVHDTVTDPAGNYTFTGLEPGEYKIRFENQNEGVEEWWENTPDMPSANALPVGKGAQVQADAHISGVAENLVPPTLSGTPAVGQTLSSTLGTWYPALGGGITTTHQWLRDGVPIPGATGSSYTLTPSDAGSRITVEVSAHFDGMREIGTSAPTAPVTGGSTPVLPIASQSAPVITGTASVGANLTASNGVWQPSDVNLGFQWLRDDVAIPGAVASTYLLVPADAGRQIKVRVTATKNGWTSTSATSSARTIAAGPATPTSVSAPNVTGTSRVGGVLTSTGGAWSAPVTTTSFQWLRDGVAIPGATAASHRLTAADAGRRVQARVTVNGGASALSAASIVQKATTSASLKLVAGKAKLKATVTLASAGARSGKVTFTVKIGKRTVKKTVTLKSGKAVATLKLPKGTRKVVATYAGDTSTAAAKVTKTTKVR